MQGVGAVGYHLVSHLHRDGAEIYCCDIDAENLARVTSDFGRVKVVAPEEIYDVDCDVYAPCAMGGTVNEKTIPRLKCSIVAGSANNQLQDEDEDAARLRLRDILYAPDYVVNAGGLINVANELEGYNRERAIQQAAGIYSIVTTIFEIARDEDITPHQAANTLAERRIAQIGKIKSQYTSMQVQKKARGII